MSIDRAGNRNWRYLWATAAMALLAGCSTAGGRMDVAAGDPGWGEANRATMAAQIVDPVPPSQPQVASGDHTQQAIERYRTDHVKHPDRERVSSFGGGGSGGGGGGSSGMSAGTGY